MNRERSSGEKVSCIKRSSGSAAGGWLVNSAMDEFVVKARREIL